MLPQKWQIKRGDLGKLMESDIISLPNSYLMNYDCIVHKKYVCKSITNGLGNDSVGEVPTAQV